MNSITPPLSATVSVLRSEPVAEGYEVACTIEQILGDEKASAELP
jgi:hypothetical protein